jgi:hypothetical protein
MVRDGLSPPRATGAALSQDAATSLAICRPSTTPTTATMHQKGAARRRTQHRTRCRLHAGQRLFLLQCGFPSRSAGAGCRTKCSSFPIERVPRPPTRTTEKAPPHRHRLDCAEPLAVARTSRRCAWSAAVSPETDQRALCIISFRVHSLDYMHCAQRARPPSVTTIDGI